MGFAVVFVVVAIIMPIIIRSWYRQYDDYSGLAALGPVGDFIGGSTLAFFNLATILLLFATYIAQKKELIAARTESQIANNTMKIQRFESTFFNMLSLYNDTVRSIRISSSHLEEWEGKRGLLVLYNQFVGDYNQFLRTMENHSKTVEGELEVIQTAYNHFWTSYEYALGHYFRNLYRIVKWIDKNEISFEDKKEYIAILKAQLSPYELKLLFYNALNVEDKDFKDLIIKYNFFDDHFKAEDLIKATHFELL